jgi:hypothetical protein
VTDDLWQASQLPPRLTGSTMSCSRSPEAHVRAAWGSPELAASEFGTTPVSNRTAARAQALPSSRWHETDARKDAETLKTRLKGCTSARRCSSRCKLVSFSGVKRAAGKPNSLGITRHSGDCRRLSSGAPIAYKTANSALAGLATRDEGGQGIKAPLPRHEVSIVGVSVDHFWHDELGGQPRDNGAALHGQERVLASLAARDALHLLTETTVRMHRCRAERGAGRGIEANRHRARRKA